MQRRLSWLPASYQLRWFEGRWQDAAQTFGHFRKLQVRVFGD
jgi:hypothetical protein